MEEEINLSKIRIIEKIDRLKSQIDSLRPISKELEQRIMQKFRLEWNFHSNAIEGNTLDYGETVAFLMHGITAKGKPFKDYLDIKGHNIGIDYVLDIVRGNDDFRETDIRGLHEVILVEPYKIKGQTIDGLPTNKTITLGQYKTSANHVKTVTGEIHFYATPEETPIKMRELMDWYNEAKENKDIHPLVLASVFHHKFVSIHPFDDGNGRMARLLTNFILMKNNFPPVIINQDEVSRNEYYLSLSQADTGKIEPFIEFMSNSLIKSLELYIKGAMGESIDEPSDFDKELALFKKELEGREDKIEVKRTLEAQKELYSNSIKPLINHITLTITKLKDMFLLNDIKLLELNNLGEWEYKPIDYKKSERLQYENQIEFILNRNIKFKELLIAFQLIEFKTTSNLFSVEAKLFLYLEDYKYNLFYQVSQYFELEKVNKNSYFMFLEEPIISNFYHKKITIEQIEFISNKIGKSLLEYIRNEYNKKNHYKLDIDLNKINQDWKNYIRGLPQSEEMKTKLGRIDVIIKDRFLTFSYFIAPGEDEIDFVLELSSLSTLFLNNLKEKYNIQGNIGIELADDIPPF